MNSTPKRDFSILEPQDYLVEEILNNSIESAEVFTKTIKQLNSEVRIRSLMIPFEFLFFNIHLVNRISLNKLGDTGREKLNNTIVPIIYNTISGIFMDAIINYDKNIDRNNSKELEKAFNFYLSKSELDYSNCKAYITPENPLNEKALFSKLGLKIANILGVPENENIVKAVIGTSYNAYERMGMLDLILEIGKNFNQ